MPKLRIKGGSFYRAAEISKDAINIEGRTIKFPFSSELPIKRYDWDLGEYWEILDHAPQSVNLERLKSKAPLLFDHKDHIGVVENAEIGSDRRGYSEVRFGKGEQADAKFKDALDGILVNASFMYDVNTLRFEKEEEGKKYFRAVNWTPYEVSLLGKPPADPTVGLGRAAEHGHEIEVEVPEPKTKEKETKNMRYCQICGAELVDGACPKKCRAAEPPVPPVDATKVRKEAETAERTRSAEIQAIADKFPQVKNIRELVQKHIADGTPVPEFRGVVLEALGALKPVLSTDIGMSQKEIEKYSFCRALDAAIDGDWSKAGLEKEAWRASEKLFGATQRSFRIPPDVLNAPFRRGVSDQLTNLTPAAGPGSNLIATNLLTGSFIDMLRNSMVTQRLGAIMLTGLVGDIAIPKQSGGATMYWIAKDGTITNKSALEILQVALSPKTAGAYTEIGRNLLKQSSLDAEGLVRRDLAMCIALGVDLAGIAGSGESNQPEGILYTDYIGAVAIGVSGGAITWPKIVALETEVSQDNAVAGAMAYLTNAKVCGQLKTIQKASNLPFIWENNNQTPGEGSVNGYRAVISNQVPSDLTKSQGSALSAVIFGNWNDLLIGMWGGLDIQVNPYSLDTSGAVRITAFQDIDVAVRHAQSFAAIVDATTT